MSRTESDNELEPQASPEETPSESTPAIPAPEGSWLVSIVFWMSLLLAGTFYGSVALAPKISVWMTLRANYLANQIQLVRLEEQVDYLKKVEHALQHDPHFTAEIARMEFRTGHANAESIPVDEQFSLSARTAPSFVERPEPEFPWYADIVNTVATKSSVRYALLSASALLILGSFTFLHDSSEMTIRSVARGMLNASQHVIGRYYSSTPPPAPEPDTSNSVA